MIRMHKQVSVCVLSVTDGVEHSGTFGTILEPLPEHLRTVVAHNIANVTTSDLSQISQKNGAENVTRFLKGVGTYGRSPYLFPEYGSSMVLQGFCRMAAVRGTIYALRVGPKSYRGSDGPGPLLSVTDSIGNVLEGSRFYISNDYIGLCENDVQCYHICIALVKGSLLADRSTCRTYCCLSISNIIISCCAAIEYV